MLGVNLKLLFKILMAIALEIALLYPITSMFGTCATYPLEDLFFAIYWPGAQWLLYQGFSYFWATFFVVAMPNNIIFGLVILLVTRSKMKLKTVV